MYVWSAHNTHMASQHAVLAMLTMRSTWMVTVLYSCFHIHAHMCERHTCICFVCYTLSKHEHTTHSRLEPSRVPCDPFSCSPQRDTSSAVLSPLPALNTLQRNAEAFCRTAQEESKHYVSTQNWQANMPTVTVRNSTSCSVYICIWLCILAPSFFMYIYVYIYI